MKRDREGFSKLRDEMKKLADRYYRGPVGTVILPAELKQTYKTFPRPENRQPIISRRDFRFQIDLNRFYKPYPKPPDKSSSISANRAWKYLILSFYDMQKRRKGFAMKNESKKRACDNFAALFDALKEAMFEHCDQCFQARGETTLLADDIIKRGCPEPDGTCFVQRWLKLLQKVRNGQ